MTDEVTGTVTRLNCQKPTFCAGRLQSEGREVSFSVRSYCKVGDTVTIKGAWEEDPKWGRQMKGKELILSLPTDANGLKKWLDWNVHGIGPVTAQRLIDEFGVDLMNKSGTDPQAVAIFAKLPLDTITGMANTWKREGSRVAAFTWFAGHGLTQKQSEAILTKLGSGAVQLVTDDPFYLIGRVEGFGWTTTDTLAKKLDITGEDPRRLRGAVAAVVREAYDNGSTCLNTPVVCQKAADKLGVRDVNKLMEVIAGGVEKGDVKRFGGDTLETEYLATPWAIKCEELIRKVLLTATHANQHGYDTDEAAKACAERYRKMGSITFDDTQVNAIANALRYRISVVTGAGGSGKTAVSKAIVKAFHDADVPVYLAAPTGKAARRMKEVIGLDASTLHRLLGFNGGTGEFTRHALDPLDNCVVLVDEFSMTCAEMTYRLFAAIGKRCALVFVGDPNQLPPVGPGSVLRDMLVHDLAPITKLDKIHRQAGALKVNSFAILNGKVEPTVTDADPSPWMVESRATTPELVVGFIKKMFTKYLPDWGFDPVTETQFMTAKHDGAYGTKKLNLVLQHLNQHKIGNPIAAPEADAHENRATIYVGDRVIQNRNDYELNVMNGEVGMVAAVSLTRAALLRHLGADDEDDEPEIVDGSEVALGKKVNDTVPVADYVINFPDRRVVYPAGTGADLQLAYCLSVHRCVHPDTLTETDQGLLPIKMIAPTGLIAGISGGSNGYRNKVTNPLAISLKIATKRNLQVTVTPDHKVEAWDGSAYTMRLASELKPGDWIRSRLGVSVEPDSVATLPAPRSCDVRAVEYSTPKTVTDDVAEFFGLMVADGTVYERGFRLKKRHDDVTERFGKLCRELFTVEPKFMTGNNLTGYEVSSVFLAGWLQDVGGMSPNAKAVPESILRSPSTIHAAFIRGLFEDATVNMKNSVCDHIEYTSVYEPLIRTVQVMLSRLGVVSSIRGFRAGLHTPGANPHFRMYIYGADCAKFRDKIGFISKFKMGRLDNCLSGGLKYMMPVTRADAESLIAVSRSARNNACTTLTVSRDTATKANWSERLNWFDDRIASIEPVECESMCVEVPNGNRFLQNGFPWGNCQGSQYPCAIIILPKSHGFMGNRSFFYTAVTRAQKTAIVIGDPDGIRRAAEKIIVDERITILDVLSRLEDSK